MYFLVSIPQSLINATWTPGLLNPLLPAILRYFLMMLKDSWLPVSWNSFPITEDPLGIIASSFRGNFSLYDASEIPRDASAVEGFLSMEFIAISSFYFLSLPFYFFFSYALKIKSKIINANSFRAFSRLCLIFKRLLWDSWRSLKHSVFFL